jgi:hypothetical protein
LQSFDVGIRVILGDVTIAGDLDQPLRIVKLAPVVCPCVRILLAVHQLIVFEIEECHFHGPSAATQVAVVLRAVNDLLL